VRTALHVPFVTASVLLSACGDPGWDGEDDIHGAHLEVQISDPRWMAHYDSRDPAFRKELHDAIEMGAASWGTSPDSVKGWRIILQDRIIGGRYSGWTDYDTRTIVIDVTSTCDMFHSSLMHELGHVKKWDPPFSSGDDDHSDPDWWTCSWVDLWWAANEASNPTYCNPSLSWIGVWRGTGADQGTCPGTPGDLR